MRAALAALLLPAAATSAAAYDEKWYNQTLDHFHPESHTRWQHRYLYSDKNWDGRGRLANGCKGPILLYTGNEGPITAFWGSNGFMIDVLAPKWGALLLFPEQRYYGKSLPFPGPQTAETYQFLTTEQVLEDYVELLAHLKKSLDAENCPVVAFGGSYGGTLTTFLRAAYPAAVVGGLASSAPIGYYDPEGWAAHGVDEYTWSDIVAKDYDEQPQCTAAIAAANAAIDAAPAAALLPAFHVCDAAGLGPDSKHELFAYALESIPQGDYPPAWPVKSTCAALVAAHASGDAALVAAAGNITAQYLGWGGGSCMPALVEGPGSVPGDGPGPDTWGWQSCTETLHEFSARGVRDYKFDFERSAAAPCRRFFNGTVTPDPMALTRRFGGYKLGDGVAGVSNLIWSNGELDPWHGGGFLKPGPASSGNHWILMKRGAHHVDLRAPTAEDPAEVTAARATEEAIIRGWIDAASRAR